MKQTFIIIFLCTILSISQINGQLNILNKLLKIIELGKRVFASDNLVKSPITSLSYDFTKISG